MMRAARHRARTTTRLRGARLWSDVRCPSVVYVVRPLSFTVRLGRGPLFPETGDRLPGRQTAATPARTVSARSEFGGAVNASARPPAGSREPAAGRLQPARYPNRGQLLFASFKAHRCNFISGVPTVVLDREKARSAKKFCGQVVGQGGVTNANSVRKRGPNSQRGDPIHLVTGLRLVANRLQLGRNFQLGK